MKKFSFGLALKTRTFFRLKKIKKLNYVAIRLDLGCGAAGRPDHIGIDYHPKATLQYDLRKGLPFPDGSVIEIRSDHFFEHLTMKDLTNIWKECYRVLQPGGVMDFTVPHIDPYFEPYFKKDQQLFNERIKDLPISEADLYLTSFERLMWLLVRDGDHKSFFDKESLEKRLLYCGFSKVSFRDFDPERDLNKRYSSAYVVAIK